MAITKLTGSRALLGGIVGNLDVPSSTWFNGIVRIRDASTDSTKGGVQLGGMRLYIKKIALAADWVNGGTTSQRDTGWDLPAFSIVDDVWLQTITAATSDTLSVGLGPADESGFLVAVTPTSGHQPTNVAGYGTLLKSASTTFRSRVPYFTNSSTAVSVVVGRSATTFSTTWAGNLYIKYYVPST